MRRPCVRPRLPVAGLLVARKRSPVQRAGEPCEAAGAQLLLPDASARGPLAFADRAGEAQAGRGAPGARAQAPASPRLAPLSAASMCTRAPPALQACPTSASCTPERLGVPAACSARSLFGRRAQPARLACGSSWAGRRFPFLQPGLLRLCACLACTSACVPAALGSVLSCLPALCGFALPRCPASISRPGPHPIPGAARQGVRVRVEARQWATGKPAAF